MEKLTEIFLAIEAGECIDTADLLPEVYDELRRIARSLLALESPGQTLQATALVHEAYLRLTRNIASRDKTRHAKSADQAAAESSLPWSNKAHFFRLLPKRCVVY